MNTQQPDHKGTQDPARDATLIPFPTPASEQVPSTPEVLDGELLSDAENAAVASRLLGRGLDQLPLRVAVLARGVGRHPRTAQVKAVAAYRVRNAPRDVHGCAGSPCAGTVGGSPRPGPIPPMAICAPTHGRPGTLAIRRAAG
jgi:hypothetical protein